jgi:hypothetical protein
MGEIQDAENAEDERQTGGERKVTVAEKSRLKRGPRRSSSTIVHPSAPTVLDDRRQNSMWTFEGADRGDVLHRSTLS